MCDERPIDTNGLNAAKLTQLLKNNGSGNMGAGIESFYESGFEDGYDEGQCDGYSQGYDSGLDDGYGEGVDEGFEEGYDVGSKDGYYDGHKKGQGEGVAEGLGIAVVIGGLLYGGIKAAPHVKRFYKNTVVPGLKKIWRNISKKEIKLTSDALVQSGEDNNTDGD